MCVHDEAPSGYGVHTKGVCTGDPECGLGSDSTHSYRTQLALPFFDPLIPFMQVSVRSCSSCVRVHTPCDAAVVWCGSNYS